MNKIQTLQNQIEVAREKMYGIAARYGFTDSRTVDQSQQLDRMMNEFGQLKNEKKPIA